MLFFFVDFDSLLLFLERFRLLVCLTIFVLVLKSTGETDRDSF